MDKIKILILTANPWETKPLGLDEEYERLLELWRGCDLRKQFKVRYRPALRADKLQAEVLQFKPHLIHFSGHGDYNGLVFTDLTGDKAHEVSKRALANLCRLCAPDLKAVFLNACYSAEQAEAIIEQVDYVIGMSGKIDDLAAINFSQGFYSAIFSQDTLNIEKAFDAGLNQMDIDHITEAEQQKPTLQKHPQTFVPNCKHDVFINFADKEAQWAHDLTDYLRKQLKQKLVTTDGFQLYDGNDFTQLAQSATLLIIASPAYCEQYHAQFAQLGTQTKQQPVFLVEYEVCNPRPEFLIGFTPYKFWRYDDYKGMMTVITGDEYVDKANELASAIAKQLIKLKNQQQRQQSNEQQLKQQHDASEQNINAKSIDGYVFLHSSLEDFNLIDEIIVPLLDENHITYALPLQKTYKQATSGEIREDIKSQIEQCNAILILHEQSAPTWARSQLGTCVNMLHKREKPLKIIALYKNPDNPDPGFPKLEHLHIYSCLPEQLTSYLPKFIEELTHE